MRLSFGRRFLNGCRGGCNDPAHHGLGQAHLLSDLAEAMTSGTKLQHLFKVALDAWSSTDPPLRPRSGESGKSALRQAHSLLLGDDRQYRDHGVFEHATGIEVLFGEAAVPHAVSCQALEVLEGLEHALPAETVERPEQHKFELPA